MKNYLQMNQSCRLPFLIVFVVLTFSLNITVSAQETIRSEIPAININDDTRHAEDIILGYTEKLNHLSEPEGGVSLLIYKDNYVIVYYPAYMKRAGTYGMYLDDAMMSRLWSLLTSVDTLAFDEEAIRRHIQALNRAKAEQSASLSRSGDGATTVIEVYPNRYQSVGFGSGDVDEMKQIAWHGLKWDANAYPDIQELQNLAMIQQVLYEIMQHVGLEHLE